MVAIRHPRGLHWQAVAGLCAVGAFAATRSLGALHEDKRLILFLGAVAISTAVGRWRAGVLTLVLSLGLYGLFYVPLVGTLAIFEGDDVIRLGLFVAMALAIIVLFASRERMQASLRMREEMLTLSLEAARMGAWSADFRTGEFWRSAGASVLDEPEAVGGATSYEAFVGKIHPEDHKAFLRAIDRAIADQRGFDIRHRLVPSGGAASWVNTRVRVIFDPAGRPERLIGVSMEEAAV